MKNTSEKRSPLRRLFLGFLPLLLDLALSGISSSVHAEQNRHGLFVGINTYSKIRSLSGCVPDATRMKEAALERWGFKEANTNLLVNEHARRQDILKSFFNNLIQKCQKDDVALFYFAGHGTQEQDFSGDEIADGMDEVLCPYDMDLEDPSSGILDDTLQEYIKALSQKCDNIIIIIDTCSSGSATLALGDGLAEEREVPNMRLRKPGQSRQSADASRNTRHSFDQDRYPDNHVLLAACLPDETAKELSNIGGAGNSPRGVFTAHLLNETANKALTPQVFQDVAVKVAATVFQAGKSKQTPTLYGKPALLSKLAP